MPLYVFKCEKCGRLSYEHYEGDRCPAEPGIDPFPPYRTVDLRDLS